MERMQRKVKLRRNTVAKEISNVKKNFESILAPVSFDERMYGIEEEIWKNYLQLIVELSW